MKLEKKIKEIADKLEVGAGYENTAEIRKYLNCLKDKELTDEFTPTLKKNGEYLKMVFVDTPARQVRKMKEKNLKVIGDSEIFNVYKESKLKNFKTTTPDRKKSKEYFEKFICDLYKDVPLNNVYIYGDNGSGKSWLASAIANEIAIKKSVAFIFFPDFKRMMTSSIIDTQTLEDKIAYYKKVDLLILDDFGASSLTHWFRDSVLLPIINSRSITKKPIIFTSNFATKELFENLISSNGKDGDVRAEINAVKRLITRIFTNTKILKLSHLKQL